jgi:hypothetical protein
MTSGSARYNILLIPGRFYESSPVSFVWTDPHIIISGQIREGPVYNGILGWNGTDSHDIAGPVDVEGLVVAYSLKIGWRRSCHDLGSAIGDAAVLSRSASCAIVAGGGPCIGTKLSRNTTLTPDVATSVEWTLVQARPFCGISRFLCTVHLRTTYLTGSSVLADSKT